MRSPSPPITALGIKGGEKQTMRAPTIKVKDLDLDFGIWITGIDLAAFSLSSASARRGMEG